MKNTIFKIIFTVIILFLFGFGLGYVIKDEEDNYPPYMISDNNGHYHRTDKFEKDSAGCVHFINIERKPFTHKIVKRDVTLCGNYTITKIK